MSFMHLNRPTLRDWERTIPNSKTFNETVGYEDYLESVMRDLGAEPRIERTVIEETQEVRKTVEELDREVAQECAGEKPSNPKDEFGISKWRQFFTVPQRVLWEVGVAMLEGALKYGRHNYRDAGVRASVYTDAAMGHITSWVEGEDRDPDTDLNHITKAITSLIVLRDGMLEGNFVDDRPPKHRDFDAHRAELQAKVDALFKQYPEPTAPVLEKDRPG